MRYTRKQIREVTGLPDKTLRWLLDRLDIQPIDIDHTLFGSPIYIYDEYALHTLHSYIFHQKIIKEEHKKGKRCRGGCGKFYAETELNSQQICAHCRRRIWIRNEVYRGDPSNGVIDTNIATELHDIITDICK